MRTEPEIKVTTTCPVEIWKAAKEKGVTMRSLLIQGWQAEENFPVMLERQKEQEDKINRIRAELETTSRELYRVRDSQSAQLRLKR